MTTFGDDARARDKERSTTLLDNFDIPESVLDYVWGSVANVDEQNDAFVMAITEALDWAYCVGKDKQKELIKYSLLPLTNLLQGID